jgi:hypothetical protein
VLGLVDVLGADAGVELDVLALLDAPDVALDALAESLDPDVEAVLELSDFSDLPDASDFSGFADFSSFPALSDLPPSDFGADPLSPFG